MGSTHKGLDGVDTYPADDWDIDSYRRAEESVEQMRIPQFLHAYNQHDRLFVAEMDNAGKTAAATPTMFWSRIATHRRCR